MVQKIFHLLLCPKYFPTFSTFVVSHVFIYHVLGYTCRWCYDLYNYKPWALERIKEALDNNFTGKILLRCMHVLVIIILHFVF
jgi:hypothetical protein